MEEQEHSTREYMLESNEPADSLLLAQLLNNNNNNANNNNNNNIPVADTVQVNRASVALELLPGPEMNDTLVNRAQGRDVEILTSPQTQEHGPLLFALLLNNNNNNAANREQNQPIADTVQLNRASVALELLPGPEVDETLVDRAQERDVEVLTRSPAQEDGPLLFAMLLGNQNNNEGPPEVVYKKTMEAAQKQNQNLPVADTVQVVRSSVALELRDVGWGDHFGLAEKALMHENSACQPAQSSANGINTIAGNSSTNTEMKPKIALDTDQLEFWSRNGYLVVNNAIDREQVSQLMTSVSETIKRLVDQQDPLVCKHEIATDGRPMNPSGRVIAGLLNEQDTFDLSLDLKPIQRVRRLGIGLHRVIPAFRSAIFTQKHKEIATSLGFKDPRVTQSLVITKASGVGVPVIPHQDGCSSFTDPPSCVTFWYALQDANEENGCLQVAPGSHRAEPISRRCRTDEQGFVEFTPLASPIFVGDPKIKDYVEPVRDAAGKYKFKSLPVKAGTLILMHGNLLHQSRSNLSSKSRVAFNFAVIEGSHPWPKDAYVRPYPGETEFEKLEPK